MRHKSAQTRMPLRLALAFIACISLGGRPGLVFAAEAPSRALLPPEDPGLRLCAASDLAAPAPADSASLPKPLRGGVTHSEVLPSLTSSLRPGAKYSDDLLLPAQAAGNDRWYHVPSWYAGQRHGEDVMIVYRYDHRSGVTTEPMQRQLERQDTVSGYQRDRKGGIWDYKHLPMLQHVESDFMNAVLFVKNAEPLRETEDQFVMRYEEISISLNKRTNKIMEVVQQEQISTISSPQPGLLRVDISVRSFDADGNPLRTEQSISFAKIVKAFEPIDEYKGVDLRKSFKEFLSSEHKEELIPDQ